ncbi:MAG: NRDE family protein [Thermoanaerobaculia bacterium]
MCLIVLAWEASPGTRLAAAANRDEFFARPTAPAAWWPDAPGVLAGRDLEAGGTWLGVTREGRFAALTNFRDLSIPKKSGAPSRGALAAGFLRGAESAREFLSRIRDGASSFEGFNLIVSDGLEVFTFSNVEGGPVALAPGVYGLSNHLLETPWPKVIEARERFEQALAVARDAEDLEGRLLALLENRSLAADDTLPETGLPLDWERALSAAFVVLPDYGTRASTSVVVGRGGDVRFVERSFGVGGAPLGAVRETFRISATPRARRRP